MSHTEQDHQYLSLSKMILEEGHVKEDRTGTGTISYFGTSMTFDLRNNRIPLLTTKKVFIKGIIHELIWMLSGDTNIRYLKEHGVNIWDSWIKPDTAEYVDLCTSQIYDALAEKCQMPISIVINDSELPASDVYPIHVKIDPTIADKGVSKYIDEGYKQAYRDTLGKEPRRLVAGDLPNIYQKQWRNLVDTRTIEADQVDAFKKRGFEILGRLNNGEYVAQRKIDQIANVIKRLKTNPDCRRLIVSAWNVAEIEDMALAPCHAFFQFWTRELDTDERYQLLTDEQKEGDTFELEDHEWFDILNIPRRALSCQMLQRSVDMANGNPFNIAFYGILTHMVAQCVNMVAEELTWVGGDTHIYSNQVNGIEEHIKRLEWMTEEVDNPVHIELDPSITNIFDFTYDSVRLLNYAPMGTIKYPPAAI